MKFKWDKKYLYWGVTAFLVIIASLLFYNLIKESEGVSTFIGTALSTFTPILYGFAFAYVLNPLLRLFEDKFLKKLGKKLFKNNEKKAKRFSRIIGLILTFIAAFAVITAVLYLVIPRVYESIITIAQNLSTYYDNGVSLISKVFKNESLQAGAISIFENFGDMFEKFLSSGWVDKLGTVTGTVLSSVISIVKTFINVLIGIIISVYVLSEKERFGARTKKVMYSTIKTKTATRFIKTIKKIDTAFNNFYVGKIIDSLILGVIVYIVLVIFDIPYKELVAVIVTITNVIPFFGPFIGAIPSALFILMIDPLKCLEFVIIIVVLQQFDGNILGPKILGSKTGLSSFWVLCALMVFGGWFGFIGMFIAIPIFSVAYSAIKTWVYGRLEKTGITRSTEEFMDIAYIDPETKEPILKGSEKDLADQKEDNESLFAEFASAKKKSKKKKDEDNT